MFGGQESTGLKRWWPVSGELLVAGTRELLRLQLEFRGEVPPARGSLGRFLLTHVVFLWPLMRPVRVYRGGLSRPGIHVLVRAGGVVEEVLQSEWGGFVSQESASLHGALVP